ncbi:MAG: WD40 repeat domain-containing protein, partial [Caldilineaceae bacterium]|nr:WD40 repeat domain-containing protein [Caldilineaceae bacterium]
SGNPLALKIVAATIRELFAGDPALFLREELLIFEDIRDLLDQQFVRLSAAEAELLLWLAVEREPVSFHEWHINLTTPIRTQTLLEAVRALEKRSLIQNNQGRFSVQNVVLEYTTDHLIQAILRELDEWIQQQGNTSVNVNAAACWPDSYFNRFALQKAQAKEYVRSSQSRMLLQPVAQHLQRRWHRNVLQINLHRLLQTLQQGEQRATGYIAANLIHLFQELGLELQGLDFAGLTVWQADLRRVNVRRVNFAWANFAGSIFMEPFSEVRALAMSPDGELLASATGSGSINIWQMHTFSLVDTLDGHQSTVLSLDFSLDGQLLASAEQGGATIVWRRSASGSWQPCLTLNSMGGDVARVAFSPDSRLLAVSPGNHPIHVWELSSQREEYAAKLRFCLGEHSERRIAPIAFSPDGQMLASGDHELIHLWDVRCGTRVQTLRGHTHRVQSLAYGPTGELLASGGTDGAVRLWHVVTSEPVATLDDHRVRILDLAFSPDGHTLATADLKNIRLWQFTEQEHSHTSALAPTTPQRKARAVHLQHVLTDHAHFVTALAFTPNGQTLVSSSLDETIRVWDAATGHQMREVLGRQRSLYTVDVNGEMVVTGDINGTIQRWHTQGKTRIQQADVLANCPKRILAVAISLDGQHVAATCANERLYVWRTSTKAQCFVLHSPYFDFGLGKLVFSPDGRRLATVCSDQSVRLWRTTDGALMHILHGSTLQFRCIAFHPDGNMVVAGTQEGRLYSWDLSCTPLSEVIDPSATLDFVEKGSITGVHFAADGKQVIYSANGSIFVMDVNSRKRTTIDLFGTHVWNVTLALSHENFIAIDTGGAQISLYNATSGTAMGLLQGHRDAVQDLAFDATGKLLYSVSLDGEIRVWDVMHQTCLDVMQAESPYTGMNIMGATGLSEMRRSALRTLGAVEL